jgi:hypothetical protein
MSRRKGETTGAMNERDFSEMVELALPPGGCSDQVSGSFTASAAFRFDPADLAGVAQMPPPRSLLTLVTYREDEDCKSATFAFGHCWCGVVPSLLRQPWP